MTLLFTIGLIVIFVLLGTTFLVVSVNYMKGARVHNTGRTHFHEPRDMSRSGMYVVTRGTRDPQSPARFHSLLDDMYDLNGFFATVNRAYYFGDATTTEDDTHFRVTTGTTLIAMQLTPSSNLIGAPVTLSPTTGAYNGQYLTFLDGPAKGTTVRIVEYLVHIHPNDAQNNPNARLVYQFVILPENGPDAANLFGNPSVLTNNRVLINSRPFNGQGFGLTGNAASNPDQPQLTRDALLPNRAEYFRVSVPAPFARVAARDWLGFYYALGGPNETYDAVDFQNMALAAVITDGGGSPSIIPSYHRPSLVSYWAANSDDAAGSMQNLADPSSNDPDDYAPWDYNDQLNWDHPNNFFPLTYREFRRQVVMRPMPWDHPNFTGGSTVFLPRDTDNDGDMWMEGPDNQPGIAGWDDDGRNGTDDPGELGAEGSDDYLDNDAELVAYLAGRDPNNLNNVILDRPDLWDVDNDGDLHNDSIWIDLGMPVLVDKYGRHYKPLFAALVVDLDNRVNVNAHGSIWHLNNMMTSNSVPEQTTDGTFTNTILRRGLGYGPGDVNPRSVFVNNNDYRRVLLGFSGGNNPYADMQRGLLGRHGMDDYANGNWPTPGYDGLDPLIQRKWFDHPAAALGSSWGSYSDPNGRYGLGVDRSGNPVYDQTVLPGESFDTAYELDLSRTAPRSGAAGRNAKDQPFSASELERVLRGMDGNAGALPERLMQLSDLLRNNPDARHLVTTDSFDLPIPNESMLLRDRLVETMRLQLGIRDNGTVTPGSYANSFDPPNQPVSPQTMMRVNAMIRELISPDLIQGIRMDVNRPFGNGADDNNNGVIDEHWHTPDAQVSEAPAWDPNNPPAGPIENIWNAATFFDHDNDGRLPGDQFDRGFLARHLMARHLYVLLMALKDPNTELDYDGDGNPSVDETPYVLAQFAINAVDFRDADFIMTPFEFDLDPFDADGWNVDGDMRTTAEPSRAWVWGMERPELLITEAGAFHDRRTEDLPVDGQTGPSANDDNDFDQRLRPHGSLFVELYNPWRSDMTRVPVELYGNYNGSFGVDLLRVHPTSGAPVWRLIIAEPDNDNDQRRRELIPGDRFLDPGLNNVGDPGNIFNGFAMNPGNIERSVYFTAADPNLPQDGTPYLPSQPVLNALRPVPPLSYAVLGPEGQMVSATQYVTVFGRRTDATETNQNSLRYADTRSIWLDPGQSVEVRQPDLNNLAQIDVQTRNCVAIPIPSLSISEPVGGYTPNNWLPGGAGGEGEYSPPYDQPFDANRNQDPLDFDGTYPGFRIVHLQRLANPLAPYHDIENPYLTVDSQHVDLTVFHGVISTSPQDFNTRGGGAPQARIEDTERGSIELETKERGDQEVQNGQVTVSPQGSRVLWAIDTWLKEANININGYSPDAMEVDSRDTSGDLHFFSFHLFESLATIAGNDTWVSPRELQDPPRFPPSQANKWTQPPAANIAFPWLTWNNRPFISHLEMVMVPGSRSSRLGYDFTLQINGPAPDGEYAWDRVGARYGHLLNFYRTNDLSAPQQNSPHLYRLFDFTQVPSRFVATERYFNSQLYQGLIVRATGSQQNNVQIGVLPLNAPFNHVSNCRDPGRINVNTIFDNRVWEALMGGTINQPPYQPWPGTQWEQWVDSRRGYGPPSPTNRGNPRVSVANMLSPPGSNIPTFFANPLRESGGSNLVVQNTGMQVRPNVESTVLRSDGIASPSADPRFDALTSTDYDDSTRMAYFQENSRFRLGNLVTTRSNVYAIWLTVGYFEFDPQSQQLGQELGSDSGEVTRNRSFYIFDRSKPLAYEPGENHNIDHGLLVDREIE